jgi:hypothetical protein
MPKTYYKKVKPAKPRNPVFSNMYKLANLLEFEQPDRGGWYCDYRLKEDLEKEKNNDK